MNEIGPEFLKVLGELFNSKLRNIALRLELEDYNGAVETASEMNEYTNDLYHNLKLKASINEAAQVKNEVNDLIKIAGRHLGELEDWVHVDKKEAQLASLYHLTETVEELNKKIRK